MSQIVQAVPDIEVFLSIEPEELERSCCLSPNRIATCFR